MLELLAIFMFMAGMAIGAVILVAFFSYIDDMRIGWAMVAQRLHIWMETKRFIR